MLKIGYLYNLKVCPQKILIIINKQIIPKIIALQWRNLINTILTKWSKLKHHYKWNKNHVLPDDVWGRTHHSRGILAKNA